MEQQINLPVKYIDSEGNTISQTVTTNLIDNVAVDENFISSKTYVPDFLQEKEVFEDATKLLDVLLNKEVYDNALASIKETYLKELAEIDQFDTEAIKALKTAYEDKILNLSNVYNETLGEINQAYCDTIYKWSAYNKLSYGAKITLLQEKGFDYVLDVLLHMYDEEYDAIVDIYNDIKNGDIPHDIPEDITITPSEQGNIVTITSYEDFVKKKADTALTKIVSLFNLINVLKGKTLGLELVLSLINLPSFIFIPWNVVTSEERVFFIPFNRLSKLPMPDGTGNVRDGDCYYSSNYRISVIKYEYGKEYYLRVNGSIYDDIVIDGTEEDVYDVDSELRLLKNGELYEPIITLTKEQILQSATPSYFIFNGVSWHQCDSIDAYLTPREPLTAELSISGVASSALQRHVTNFVRSYMLPLIRVSLKFTDAMPTVYAIPSGAYNLYKTMIMEDYYLEGSEEKDYSLVIKNIHNLKTVSNMSDILVGDFLKTETVNDGLGEHIQRNLQHRLSDSHWFYSDMFTRQQIYFGKPIRSGNGFDGNIDLLKSYVIDENGDIHYLYGNTPSISYYVQGNALDKMDEYGNITNYEGTFVDVGLGDYIEIDFETGEQQQPHYVDDEFFRDTFINFAKSITIGDLHLAKRIEQIHSYDPTHSVPSFENLPAVANEGDVYEITNSINKYLYANGVWNKLSYPDILIEDFQKDFTEIEVYLGINTELLCVSGKNYNVDYDVVIPERKEQYKETLLRAGVSQREIDLYVENYLIVKGDYSYYRKDAAKKIVSNLVATYPILTLITDIPQFYEFEYSEIEQKEDAEVDVNHLVFCEAKLDENYTGIGDLGILGSNNYFIYNGMLFYHEEDNIVQIGDGKTWTDIGASHAVSNTYYTPAINDGNLFYIQSDYINRIVDENCEYEDGWAHITGYINEYYTAFGIKDGMLYKLYRIENPLIDEEGIAHNIIYEILDAEEGWTYITGAAYSKTYEAYGIKAGVLYRISADGIKAIGLSDGREISGISNVTRTSESGYDEFVYTTINGHDDIEIIYGGDSITVETEYEDGTIEETTYPVKEITSIIFNGVSQEFYFDAIDSCYISDVMLIHVADKLKKITIETDEYSAVINFENGELSEFKLTEITTIEGWDDSFDCISRYHHCNSDYTTYGIANNVLYAITNEQNYKLDDSKTWTAICGFYNENSPRTFGYAIADGKLYELQGKTSANIILKDSSMYWTEIHGCSTANNNFIMGIAKELTSGNTEPTWKVDINTYADTVIDNNIKWTKVATIGNLTWSANTVYALGDIIRVNSAYYKFTEVVGPGYIYKINAKSLSKLDETKAWVHCFGRYTSSTTPSNNCYGYGIKQVTVSGVVSEKLYQFTKDGTLIISGFWKKEGDNYIARLSEYNIENIRCILPDSTVIEGEQAIKEIAPYPNTILSDYDIYAIYTTKGFNNNTRYILRTEKDSVDSVYVSPEECRYNVSEENCRYLFDIYTGTMSNFIETNYTLVGTNIVDGNGVAHAFLEYGTHIIMPARNYNVAVISLEFTCEDENIYPLCLDSDSDVSGKTGVYYGYYNGKYGLILKKEINGSLYNEVIVETNKYETKAVRVKYVKTNDGYDVYTSVDGTFSKKFTSSIASNSFVYAPYYIGGNGTLFGDGTFYLATSYISYRELDNDVMLPLFINGKYFSVKTQGEDIVETFITDETQVTSKVIEVIKENNEVVELSMDVLYTQMTPNCTVGDLNVTTDYNYNKLRHDSYEGTTISTLTYVGAYTLEPTLINYATSSELPDVCDFDRTGMAKNLKIAAPNIYFKLANSFNEPIIIKTHSTEVSNQVFFKTEEGEAYTNKYLLQSTVTGISDVECRFVPSGIVYELYSDKPQTVTKNLVYNAELFEIDPNKIIDYSAYEFDRYAALLNYRELEENDHSLIYLTLEDSGNSGTVNSTAYIKINSDTVNQDFMQVDGEFYKTLGIGDYYYKFDISQTFVEKDINTDWITPIEPIDADEKDLLQYEGSLCWNFSPESYFELRNISSTDGFVLRVITDDDVSKDQGIFGIPNSWGFGIKDNQWVYTDSENMVHFSNVVVQDNGLKYIEFRKVNDVLNIYISDDNKNWTILFENASIEDVGYIGYANVKGEMLQFNGTIDLAKSYIENPFDRLFRTYQTTVISVSTDGETFDIIKTLDTHYSITDINIGYQFTGSLDCYYSKLLKSYELNWVCDGKDVSNAVKEEIQKLDPYYNPSYDYTNYGIEEYGVYVDGVPKRWDEISVTYTTVDKAFYMQPDTDYLVGFDTVEDEESGKYGVDIMGNPTWNLGVVSDFENGYLDYIFQSIGYTVFKIELNGDNQAICSYDDSYDTTPPCIFIQNGVIKYFDNEITHDLFTPTQNIIYLKLPTDLTQDNPIEYSYDNITFIPTACETTFTAYEAFALGKGHINGVSSIFRGSFDIANSYYVTDNVPTYLFQYYKKIIPYIIDNGVKYPLTVEPLLTLNDYVYFAYSFNGSIDLYHSGLCSEVTRRWEANQINIYESIETVCITYDNTAADLQNSHTYSVGDRFNAEGHSFEVTIGGTTSETVTSKIIGTVNVGDKVYFASSNLLDSIIRDDVSVDPTYTKENEKVAVNPTDLEVYFDETPIIGNKIVLTYNTWYMFREVNTEHQFKITKIDDKSVFSFYRPDGTEQFFYETAYQELVVNTGFQFNGILSVKDSTRGGMPLCDYFEYYTYVIKYRKYEDEEWDEWCRFISNKSSLIHEKIGYDLLGTHYLPSSTLKMGDVETPFVTFYNQEYIKPVGGVSFSITQPGIVSRFSDTAYLEMIMEKLTDGCKVLFWARTGSKGNQGVCTWLGIDNGYFCTDEKSDINDFRVKANYSYLIEYTFGSFGITLSDVDAMDVEKVNYTTIEKFENRENQMSLRIMGYNENGRDDMPYTPIIENKHYVTVIPCNFNKKEGETGYFVETSEQADNIKSITYRKVEHDYDHFTGEGEDIWYNADLEKHTINYFNKTIEVYAAIIPFGNTNDAELLYYKGDVLEIRIDSDITTYNLLTAHNDLVYTQRAEF